MKKLALVAVFALAISVLFAQNTQTPLPGRFFKPMDLYAALKNQPNGQKASPEVAQSYLVGVYDLTQETGKSCATRGTVTPTALAQSYISYVDANPIPKDTLATHAQLLNATAAGIAQKAFMAAWPCQ
jgi:hypothetical protein